MKHEYEKGFISLPVIMLIVFIAGSITAAFTPATLNNADAFKATTNIQRAVISIYADPDPLDSKKESRNETWLSKLEFAEIKRIVNNLEQQDDALSCYKPEELEKSTFMNSFLWPWFEDETLPKDEIFRKSLIEFLRK